MKLVNRSPIFWAFEPASWLPSASPSMIVLTRFSDSSARAANAPQAERSAGMSVVSSHVPLTCRKRSSCGRMSGFMPARASSRIVTRARV